MAAEEYPSPGPKEVERLPDHDKALVKSFLDAFVEGITAR